MKTADRMKLAQQVGSLELLRFGMSYLFIAQNRLPQI